ncbi:MAG TPA: Rrf2 family transcriptional regulator [Candidatus Hydrogenedentes bacterium]|nr:Rrf2 family transcriptional regulator [Candidatus Hydrogenedentota bacterium]HOL75483.1 Rrf2 family transcriptional regulator [Candidatus Hydrogenedentota bacterium]HPO86075.1 Rrf2 family transcriptional regulator [Candidatus Hydrogenedentota bacterium]
MNISSRCEYACRAMVELACFEKTGEPLTAQQIAERRNIPEKYLVHILLQLKRAGLVRSVRGAQGGYTLAASASQISLKDIVTAIDGPILNPLPAEDSTEPDMTLIWNELSRDIENLLSSYTLSLILERTSRFPMYHI